MKLPLLLWCHKDALETFSNFPSYTSCDSIFHEKIYQQGLQQKVFFLCQHYEIKHSWKTVAVKGWMEADVWKRIIDLVIHLPTWHETS